MGIPVTMSLALSHSYAPYRFGAAYPPVCPPQVYQHNAHDFARQAHALRDASAWWAAPRMMQPAVSFPMVSNLPFGAPVYPYPPVQLPYQHYSVPPLGAIHNTRCATMPSPSSASDMDASPKPSPDPQFVHVVCNAPLLAPKPLPYHSPTFLQFDLPDDDEDLSHPPYVSRPHKRKRVADDEDDEDAEDSPAAMKRRVVAHSSIPHPRRRSPAASHAASLAVSGRHMR